MSDETIWEKLVGAGVAADVVARAQAVWEKYGPNRRPDADIFVTELLSFALIVDERLMMARFGPGGGDATS